MFVDLLCFLSHFALRHIYERRDIVFHLLWCIPMIRLSVCSYSELSNSLPSEQATDSQGQVCNWLCSPVFVSKCVKDEVYFTTIKTVNRSEYTDPLHLPTSHARKALIIDKYF